MHASHHQEILLRFSGWWGNDPKTRFQMQLQPEFIPHGGVYSWQVSTPSILSMTPLAASLKILKEAGMDLIREKSKLQTTFLSEFLKLLPKDFFEVITPSDSESRGGQLSLLIHKNSEECLQKLEKLGAVCDFIPPNIIRVTLSPLYTTFYEIYQFGLKFMEALAVL